MQLTLTPLAEDGVTVLPPDILFNGLVGDFALSTDAADGPIGGLVAANPLRTAVILLAFTDARAEPEDLRFEHGGDRRGWPGDGFDIQAGEAPLGSKLWLYRRHELTDATGLALADEIQRALKPLVDQRVVARIEATATVDKAAGRIALAVNLYGRDGRSSYAEAFDILWRRADGKL